MAKKHPKPIITHTEILSLALRSIDAEIVKWEKTCLRHPEMLDEATCELKAKREALAYFYQVETGTEY